ncbi:unnamed protein product [Bursaphelenchus okinawaensis]|uniref:THAP-type domain-containing protein n=1 Tax=Bursaphelenchus okinawaensis TaxID=465554 RepID=A0A811LAW7_9BILA|nr:unnamed protein product [Bursaphelenchus okinawaensis]CAG9119800.1 unnamed protein product [Bursaphelenchus okinawaensis]
MSRGGVGNEKCVFCGWNRRNAYHSVRFFCIPKEPGLKRVRWLQVFGDREISPKDRVCSVHFRQGRPSSDPSHEDFVPHLYLNNEPPAEVLDYLESLADTNTKLEKIATLNVNTKSPFLNVENSHSSSGLMKLGPRTTKPSILKRKRRPKSETFAEDEDVEVNVTTDVITETIVTEDTPEQSFNDQPPTLDNPEPTHESEAPTAPSVRTQPTIEARNGLKFTAIQQNIVDTVGIKPGQTVIIRRRVKKPKQLLIEQNAEKQS